MKGIYILDPKLERDHAEIIARVGRGLDFIAVGIILDEGQSGIDYLDCLSTFRKGLIGQDLLGVSINYFRRGYVEDFIRKSGADCVLVPTDGSEGC